MQRSELKSDPCFFPQLRGLVSVVIPPTLQRYKKKNKPPKKNQKKSYTSHQKESANFNSQQILLFFDLY